MKTSGFTLVELIIAMALLSVVLGILLTTQSTVLRSSMKEQSSAVRLGVITDITGYVGDRIKAAAMVPDGLTVNGASCQRTPASGLPCLAVVVPQVAATGQLSGWELHTFQYVASELLTAAERTPGLAGLSVALRESQLTSGCGVIVPTSATLNSCFSGTPFTSLLSDELVLPTGGQAAFDYDTGRRVVTLRMRSVSVQSGTAVYLPVANSYTLNVYARNVSP